MPDSARIVVHRPRGGGRDLLRKHRIEIDGARAGTVGRGDTAELTVPAGTHRVRARIDWLGSGTLRVELGAADGAGTPEHEAVPRFPWVGLIGVPFAFVGIFLVSYGVHGLIHHDRAFSWVAVVGGVLLSVVPLALARRARRRRRDGGNR